MDTNEYTNAQLKTKITGVKICKTNSFTYKSTNLFFEKIL